MQKLSIVDIVVSHVTKTQSTLLEVQFAEHALICSERYPVGIF